MKPTRDVAQANRMRWFLAAHLLAVLGIFEASLWAGEHLATKPDPIPTAHVSQGATPERPQPQQFARQDSLAGQRADEGDEGRWRPAAQRDVAYDDRPGASPVTSLP
jgi:hypothetical protein